LGDEAAPSRKLRWLLRVDPVDLSQRTRDELPHQTRLMGFMSGA
jgi:hypothetical protein